MVTSFKSTKKCLNNGCIIYVDIMTGKKMSSFYLAIFPVIYWSGCSSSAVGGEGIEKEGIGIIVILARYRFHFIREHEDLV